LLRQIYGCLARAPAPYNLHFTCYLLLLSCYVTYFGPGRESLRQIYGCLARALLKLFPALRACAMPLTDALVVWAEG
jgi:hypothetical protein